MVDDLNQFPHKWFKFLGDPEFNYSYLFVKIRAIWDFSSQLLCEAGVNGPVFSYCACGLDGGERFRGGGILIFLIIARVPLLFMQWCFTVLDFLCGLQQEKDPKGGIGGRRLTGAPWLAFCGILAFYCGWREGRALQLGWVPQGWVVWTSAKHKVSARDNCLLSNTIISANKNCLHSHKQIILGPDWLARFYHGNYFS